MKLYKFVRSVVIDGASYADGQAIGDSEISAGALESLVRVGHVVPAGEYTPPQGHDVESRLRSVEAEVAMLLGESAAKEILSRGDIEGDVAALKAETAALREQVANLTEQVIGLREQVSNCCGACHPQPTPEPEPQPEPEPTPEPGPEAAKQPTKKK